MNHYSFEMHLEDDNLDSDQEVLVEVYATGKLTYDSFNKIYTISGLEITGIHDLDNNKKVKFEDLTEQNQRRIKKEAQERFDESLDSNYFPEHYKESDSSYGNWKDTEEYYYEDYE